MVFLIFLLLLFGEDVIGEGKGVIFRLEVVDLVEGEYGIGGSRLFNLVIENNRDEDIYLGTGTASPWLYYSGFWEVEIRGPIDERCKRYESPTVEEPGPYPYFPSIKVNARDKYKVQLTMIGVGEAGEYEVRVIYKGEKIGGLCGYCLNEGIKSEVYKFKIKKAEGVDLDVIKHWKERNRDKPICLFPLGMKREEILEKFPTSTYAGWVLKNYQYSCYDYDKECLKMEKIIYRDRIEAFISVKQDFIFSGFLASKAANISMELSDIPSACYLYEKGLKLKWEVPGMDEKIKIKEMERAKENYNNLKEKGNCK